MLTAKARATTARLLIECPDQPGIVAAVTGFLAEHGASINHLDQHSSDLLDGTFYMRVECQTPDLDLTHSALSAAFGDTVARRFGMNWGLDRAQARKRVLLFVSRQDHALLELLWRHARGELHCDIVGVVSNHPDARAHAEAFKLPFHHIPVSADTKAEAEAVAMGLARDADLLVLARYMQILGPAFVAAHAGRIINIHHSFLPAFVGADPYAQASERGVKLIGATAHYVTADLDAGPIIDQDVVRVTHRESVAELRALGRDVGRRVLARAVQWHLEDRVIVSGNRTVVFR